MLPLPLRSIESVKRIAHEQVSRLLPSDWPHAKILDVTAALYGYDHWAHLYQAARADATDFPFDQDLSYDELTARQVLIAKHVDQRCDIPFPYAFELTRFAGVTRDFRRDYSVYLSLGDDPYQRALLNEDWWWIGSRYEAHPLVPIGFNLCRAAHVAALADWRINRRGGPAGPETVDVLLPEDADDHPFCRITDHLYFRRDQLLEVEPTPLAAMMPASYRPSKRHIFELRGRSSAYDLDDWPERIKIARAQFQRLAVVAGLSLAETRRAETPLDIRARDILGVPWYWPLVLKRDPAGKLAREYEQLERSKWVYGPG